MLFLFPMFVPICSTDDVSTSPFYRLFVSLVWFVLHICPSSLDYTDSAVQTIDIINTCILCQLLSVHSTRKFCHRSRLLGCWVLVVSNIRYSNIWFSSEYEKLFFLIRAELDPARFFEDQIRSLRKVGKKRYIMKLFLPVYPRRLFYCL